MGAAFDRPVQPNRPRKSSGSETTFDEDYTEPAAIEAGVVRMADDVWAWCEKHNTYGQTVTVKVKFATFQIITRSRTLSMPITEKTLLREVSLTLVRSIYPVKFGVRLVGVSVAKLEKAADAVPQLELVLAHQCPIKY